ncbi:hypothetical protein IGI04_040336 [Brassica rapa subsp. trilocularis]|uniref:PHD finger-like domain-containing protein 5A n=1 Tax=Brassica rapa subsp. trilocularis TaxID=1813537 RepID=A0ABQ7KQK0_BRACM|nr:hypothetical protein IGI04_040336 [Brassica rapa subsp. trilocularis]
MEPDPVHTFYSRRPSLCRSYRRSEILDRIVPKRLVLADMAKHHPDLIMCRKQPGIAIGRLCEKCDGKCVVCDSYVRPCTLVRICDECNYGSFQGRCVICGGVGISDAYYCKECTQQEKDRDGCPKIVNLGSAKTDLFYERKKYGFKKR